MLVNVLQHIHCSWTRARRRVCLSFVFVCCGVSLEDVMLLPGVRESSPWGPGAERGARAAAPRER